MSTKPKAKKKCGIVVTVKHKGKSDTGREWLIASVSPQDGYVWLCYKHMRRAGLPELKPGESVKVRVVIEEL